MSLGLLSHISVRFLKDLLSSISELILKGMALLGELSKSVLYFAGVLEVAIVLYSAFLSVVDGELFD